MTRKADLEAVRAALRIAGLADGGIESFDDVGLELLWQIAEIRAQQESEPDAMSDVADRYAHKLALDLECVLADYSGKWYDEAINTIGEYRSAMNAIHERESPTFMGEPMLTKTKAQQGRKPDTLCDRLQQKCSDWNTYWRASDAHGVVLSQDQASELLRDALGVEVDISLPTDEIQDLRDHAVRMLEKSFPSPLAQQERNPHTEAEVQEIFSALGELDYAELSWPDFELLIRRVLGVPAP